MKSTGRRAFVLRLIKFFFSVLRRLLKTGPSNSTYQRPSESLLGYQGNCLSAPAEVSSWTRFCEIDLPETTSQVLAPKALYSQDDYLELPVDVARYELKFPFAHAAEVP